MENSENKNQHHLTCVVGTYAIYSMAYLIEKNKVK